MQPIESSNIMKTTTASTALKDPICGMTVDPETAIHADRDGKTFYFCGDACLKKFKALPAGKSPSSKTTGCCG